MLPQQLLSEIASTHPPVLHHLAQRLRAMALASGPGTTEEVKYGGILFAGLDGFCGVFVYAAHVTLEFGNGVALDDPNAELMGKGKGHRHLKFTTEDNTALARAQHFIQMARSLADQPRK
jgi:hypothetical protein